MFCVCICYTYTIYTCARVYMHVYTECLKSRVTFINGSLLRSFRDENPSIKMSRIQ